jgi:hypothetical protein
VAWQWLGEARRLSKERHDNCGCARRAARWLGEARGVATAVWRGARNGKARSDVAVVRGMAAVRGSRCSTTCFAAGAHPMWSPTTSSSRWYAVQEATDMPWSWSTSLVLCVEEMWMTP